MHSRTDPNAWDGRFTDGQTARSQTVVVSLTARGLEIDDRNETSGALERRLMPYDTITTASPITRSSEDVLLSFASQPGATLFVANPEFVRQLAVQVPNLTAGAQRWRVLKPIMAVIAGIIALGATLWALDVSPAKTVASLMPDKLRQSLGDSVVASMVGKRPECKNPEGRAALDKLVSRLSIAAESPRHFAVRVVDWKLVNAFATPGERIILTRAILASAASPDEIAGILAHEMGHGIELHPEAGLVRAIGMAAALEMMMGGGNLANLGLFLAQVQYTRIGEREADRHALRILKSAAISPNGLVTFFNRLATKEGAEAGSTTAALMRTHPFSKDRARIAAAQAAYPATPALTPAEWQALLSICKR